MAIYPHPNMRKIFDIANRLNNKLAIELSQRPVMSMPQEGDEPDDSPDLGDLPEKEREHLEKLYDDEWVGIAEQQHKSRPKSMKQTRLDMERALEKQLEVGAQDELKDNEANVTRAIIAQLDAKEVDPDKRPSIIGLSVDGDEVGYWVWAPATHMY